MRVTRLATGGRVDRAKPISFEFEGRTLSGFAGDTLASALLANGVRLMGRSFKYHRPRGLLSAGVEEPNALLTVGEGGRRTPNLPATCVDLVPGLCCERQNGWPSVDVDLSSVFGWFSPLLGAGFYYKTFMGPRRGSWMFYEKYIRRSAGLGRATHAPDPDRYETCHRHTDLLVIGAGPAGLSAALVAARSGCRVLIVEQDASAGGSLLAEPAGSADEALRAELLAQLSALEHATLLLRATAFGLYDGLTVGVVERRGERGLPGAAREILHVVRARQMICATGAVEQPLVFGNNDRPGVMLAGAVRRYLHHHALRLGDQPVVVTENDSAWQTACDLAAAGASVTIVDRRPAVSPALTTAAAAAGIRVCLGSVPVGAHGSRWVQALTVQTADGRREKIACDLIAVSGGFAPVISLTTHTGQRTVYHPALGLQVAGVLPDGVLLAGSAASGAETGQLNGRLVGAAAVRALGSTVVESDAPSLAWQPVPAALAPALPVAGKAFVDLQSDVTVADLALSLEDGFEAPEHLKRYTALGMATDQGKTSHHHGLHWLARLRQKNAAELGVTTHRPPYTPVSVGVLAGRSIGAHFRPVRRSPMHAWHEANGACFIEAGHWRRPWYYRWAGNDVAKAYIAEMACVRTKVGLSDVSSLGKIDIQGPDAGVFLDRVYVNGFSTLPVGKARYGVMLNDDATVLDDGTTARFAENRYFMTTTTAQAGEVMSWLEFLLQTVWPELRVQVVSVTDRWAGMSLAGPRARAVLARAFPMLNVTTEALPHMGVLEATIGDTTMRILRLSFSGELAYEIYAPADQGIAVWEHVLACGREDGIQPYGLEALASLRIEKGHVAGIELDHRNTLDDLGLGRMASKTKAFIGRELSQRAELKAPGRWSLIGLEALDAGAILRGGAILFAKDDPVRGHGRGYITSVTWSVELGRLIALGLYQGGLAHEGEEIVCAFPLKGEQIRARIVSPMFIDPKGERLHV